MCYVCVVFQIFVTADVVALRDDTRIDEKGKLEPAPLFWHWWVI